MIVNFFEALWLLADQAREDGNPQRAVALYRVAFAQLGLDFDTFCAQCKRPDKQVTDEPADENQLA